MIENGSCQWNKHVMGDLVRTLKSFSYANHETSE